MSLLHVLALSVAALSLLAVFLLFWIYHLSRQLDATRAAVRHLENLLRQAREAEVSAYRPPQPDKQASSETPKLDKQPSPQDELAPQDEPTAPDLPEPESTSSEKAEDSAGPLPDEVRWFSVYTGEGFEPVALKTPRSPASAAPTPLSQTPRLDVQWA